MNHKKLNIVILGAGNLAWHLSRDLQRSGQNIVQIYNRTENKALEISQKLKCSHTCEIKEIKNNADLYLLCVNDNSISKISNQLLIKNKLVVHTSGSIDIKMISQDRKGVFYPVQSFTKENKINFKNIPLCIEGNNKADYEILLNLGKQISNKVYKINSEQRKTLHVSAVFANNFSNYMYSISHDILTQKNISFEILKPLIIETANKIISNSPKDVQTGPAIRNDLSSIEVHLKELKNGIYYDIYQMLTKQIIRMKNEL